MGSERFAKPMKCSKMLCPHCHKVLQSTKHVGVEFHVGPLMVDKSQWRRMDIVYFINKHATNVGDANLTYCFFKCMHIMIFKMQLRPNIVHFCKSNL